jgi:hypothetical protein
MGCGCKERRERIKAWINKAKKRREARKRAREAETPKQKGTDNAE